MRSILNARIEPLSPVDHYALPIGSVIGGDESERGAGLPIRVHEGRNCYTPTESTIVARRQQMNRTLEECLSNQTQPFSFPVILEKSAGGLLRIQSVLKPF